MSLHGKIQANGETVGGWVATRVSDKPVIRDDVYEYSCSVTMYAKGLDGAGPETTDYHFPVHHRYADGALALAAKVLSEASLTAPRASSNPTGAGAGAQGCRL